MTGCAHCSRVAGPRHQQLPVGSGIMGRIRAPKFVYLPFGAGPRQCIGNQFALIEAQLIVATLAQGYRLHLVPRHRVEPWALITLRPRFGMPMIIERRTAWRSPSVDQARPLHA
jgi:Cytochrome P450